MPPVPVPIPVPAPAPVPAPVPAPAPGAPPIKLDRFARAAEYSEAHGGLSMLVMHDGAVVFERHAPGAAPGDAHALASGTKSFSGVMLAAAVEDGLLVGFDELVADTITEWKTDPRKSRITLRQLLSLTGGLDGGSIGRPPSYADALGVATFAEPGVAFRYGPAPFQIFGEVMRRKLAPRGESVRGYLERRALRPLGMDVGWWNTDRDGNINLPSGAAFSAREWAKLGEFMRNVGRVRTESGWTQVVRSDLLAELLRGSTVNPRYGLTFWLLSGSDGLDPEEGLREQARRGAAGPLRRAIRSAIGSAVGDTAEGGRAPKGDGPAPDRDDAPQSLDRAAQPGVTDTNDQTRKPTAEAAPSRAFMAAGLGKQRLYVLPEQGLVVVRQGRLERSSEFKDAEFLAILDGVGVTERDGKAR